MLRCFFDNHIKVPHSLPHQCQNLLPLPHHHPRPEVKEFFEELEDLWEGPDGVVVALVELKEGLAVVFVVAVVDAACTFAAVAAAAASEVVVVVVDTEDGWVGAVVVVANETVGERLDLD